MPGVHGQLAALLRPRRADWFRAMVYASAVFTLGLGYFWVTSYFIRHALDAPVRAIGMASLLCFFVTLAFRADRRMESAGERRPRVTAALYGVGVFFVLAFALLTHTKREMLQALFGNGLVWALVLMWPVFGWLQVRSRLDARACAKCAYRFSDDGRMPVCPECGSDWYGLYGLRAERSKRAPLVGLLYMAVMLPIMASSMLWTSAEVLSRMPSAMVRAQAMLDDWKGDIAWKELIKRGITASEHPEMVDELLDQRLGLSPSLSNTALLWLEGEVLAGQVAADVRDRFYSGMYEPSLRVTAAPRVGQRAGTFVSYVSRTASGQQTTPFARISTFELTPEVETQPTPALRKVTTVHEAFERYRFMPEPSAPVSVQPIFPGVSFVPKAARHRVKVVLDVWVENNGLGSNKPTSVFDKAGMLVPSPSTVWHKRLELERDMDCAP